MSAQASWLDLRTAEIPQDVGNKGKLLAQAARRLGISHTTLRNKINFSISKYFRNRFCIYWLKCISS